MILLLNLLIAIMGDTFDRVKRTEEAQLLMGRARFIDACEAALSETRKVKIEWVSTNARERESCVLCNSRKQIAKYVCVVMPVDDESESSSSQWTGRLNNLENALWCVPVCHFPLFGL